MSEHRDVGEHRASEHDGNEQRVAVIGGGIAGLAAAYDLHRAGVAVTVYEADDRLGGKLRSGAFAGRTIDYAADSLLARVPWGRALCDELGLGPELVSPVTGRAYVWCAEQLHPLPQGLVLGIPTDLDALAASTLLSEAGVERARRDLTAPANGPWADAASTGPDVDETIGSLVRRRLGDEVLERLVDPLVGGINAGSSDELSVRAVTPQIADAALASNGGSLIDTLVRQRAANPPDSGAPVFYGLPGGMQVLVDALVDALVDGGGDVDLRLGVPVTALEPSPGRRWIVHAAPDDALLRVDAVVLATPAFAAAPVLAPAAPGSAAILAAIPYASVAMVLVAYASDDVPHDLDASGFLVPRAAPLPVLTACSWASSKWAHHTRPDVVVFRASAGRYGDEQALDLDDASLADRVADDLARVLGITAPPLESLVVRWPRSLPQYTPGHLARMDTLDAMLAGEAPGVVLAGAAYRGLGVPACIRSGRVAAQQVLERINCGAV